MKKLECWKDKLAPIFKDNPTEYVLIKRLKTVGFRRLNTLAATTSTSGIVLLNKSQRLIVKKSFLIDSVAPPRAIPTRILYDDDHDFKWLIQPLAKTLSYKEQKNFENRGVERYEFFGCDSHGGNVGYYRNKLVAIDW